MVKLAAKRSINMKKDNFLKKLGLCIVSVALCVSLFAACDNTEEKSDNKTTSDMVTDSGTDDSVNGSSETQVPQSQEMTRVEFFTELKKREMASIAAKKWDRADLVINAVIDGETKMWNRTEGKIVHSSNGTGDIQYEQKDGSTSLLVIGFSMYEKRLSQVQTEKYEKIGESIKFTWYAVDEISGASRMMEGTINVDGYLTDCTDNYFDKTYSSEMKIKVSNYAGEGIFPDASESESGNE